MPSFSTLASKSRITTSRNCFALKKYFSLNFVPNPTFGKNSVLLVEFVSFGRSSELLCTYSMTVEYHTTKRSFHD